MGIIDIGDTPGTNNNNSNNTIEPYIKPSKEGVGRKESDHTDSVAWVVLDHVRTIDLDLEKGSLLSNPKISESTTTINDFIALSTITTINNDIKIYTGTPYHTSNNFNNINNKECGSQLINNKECGSQLKVEVENMNEPAGPISDSRTSTINNSTSTSTNNNHCTSTNNNHCTSTTSKKIIVAVIIITVQVQVQVQV